MLSTTASKERPRSVQMRGRLKMSLYSIEEPNVGQAVFEVCAVLLCGGDYAQHAGHEQTKAFSFLLKNHSPAHMHTRVTREMPAPV
jgi:hypothetical protein